MIYMVGSTLSEQRSPDGHIAAEKNIAEMERGVTSSPNVKVLLETGGGNGLVSVDNSNTTVDFRNVQRHQILNHKIQTLEHLGPQDMGHSKTLSDFIVWGMSQFPAKKYALIFWDHGSGINGFGRDVIFHDTLNLDKLQKALLDANQITRKSFEIIGFDACLMASIEVANKIMPFGKYMVASEGIIPAAGWDYSAVLSNLTTYPNQDGISAGRTIADSFAKQFTNPIDMKSVTISVVSLEKIAQAINDINNLSNHLLTIVSDAPSSLLMANAADSTLNLGSNDLSGERCCEVDLFGLLFHIKEKFPVLRYLIDRTQKSMKDAVLYNVRGDSKPNATGLSIYMPISLDQFDNLVTSSNVTLSIDSALKGWQNVINNQYILLRLNKEYPYIDAYIDQGTIKGHIKGAGVSIINLFQLNSTEYDSSTISPTVSPNSLYYDYVMDPNIVRPDGSFEYKWYKQILSLCNEQKCYPTSVVFNTEEKKQFANFIVNIAKSMNSPKTTTGLVYEVNENKGVQEFNLSGIESDMPVYDLEGTVAKQQQQLLKTGYLVYPMANQYKTKPPYLTLVSQSPIQILNPEHFMPKYSNLTRDFHVVYIYACNYSDNCSITTALVPLPYHHATSSWCWSSHILSFLHRHNPSSLCDFNKTSKSDASDITNRLLFWGNVFIRQGNYTQAIQYYNKALGIDPKNVYALNNKGFVLQSVGNNTGAIKYYDKALAVQPNDVYALNHKGFVLQSVGNYTHYYDGHE